MSTAILESPIAEVQTIPAPESISAQGLAAAIEKLVGLRFLIILTARTEASESTELERRQLLRRDLARLRTEYGNKIDEIAMQYGVQAAIDAKEDVERQVTVPRTARLPMRDEPGVQVWF